jgi:hypothetical protein
VIQRPPPPPPPPPPRMPQPRRGEAELLFLGSLVVIGAVGFLSHQLVKQSHSEQRPGPCACPCEQVGGAP